MTLQIAPLPPAWLAILPEPGASHAEPVAVAYESTDTATVRQRIADLARGKKGDEWGALRRAVAGERMFRIEGGPGDPEIPLVIGVDDFLSKRVIWTLAAEIPTTPPDEIALALEPSLSILRSDVASLGGAPSRWTSEHVRSKWIRASEKIEADNAEARAFVDRLSASAREGAERRATSLPLVIQFDDRFYGLDDRTESPRYEGPMRGATLRAMLRELWGDRRALDTASEKTTRPMTPAEIVEAYGRAVASIVTEYAALEPRVDDLTLVLPGARSETVEPREDRDVAEWLATLDPSGGLIDWIAYARADRCSATVPALALIGGAHVGKSLLADGIARAYGARRATPLSRVLGRFGSMLQAGPVLFSDEGLPRDPRSGIPLTEEFRALVTSMDHVVELKGIDRSVFVRGGVRAILAANRMDRLFSNRGTYSGSDVDALVRRLFVVEIEDPAQVERAKALALSLGSVDGDPVRLARVAGHLAHIQATHPAQYPAPRARTVERALRLGGDLAKRAIETLDDAAPAEWIAPSDGVLWVQVRPWISALHEDSIAPVARALASYVSHPSERRRTHPTTGAPDPARSRWIGLDRLKLAHDGVTL